jgi:hypothetical protein
MIYVSAFQPFASRIGQDTVIKLTFEYNPDLIAFLKRALRNYKDEALDPSRHIFQPGGWNPKEKCWYVERSIWDMVRKDLMDHGYDCIDAEAAQ